MGNWESLAREFQSAAKELWAGKRWRSCANRAYYAAYAEVAEKLSTSGMTFPVDREGPAHTPLPNIIGNNLHELDKGPRWKLSSAMKELYDMRCIADYRPSVSFEADEARISFALMDKAIRIMKSKEK